MSVDFIGETNQVILELKIYTSTLKNYDQESFHFYTFQFVQNFRHVSAYICILLRSSLFRIILIPDDIFRLYKNFRLPVLLGNFGFSSLSFFPYISYRYTSVQDWENFLVFLCIFLYIWKIIASNKIDLAVYSSDVFLLSSEYLARIYPLIGNIAFQKLYYCAVLT